MRPLSKVQSRMLALGILGIVLLLLFNLLFGPLITRYLENRDQVNRLEHQLEVYQRVAANLDENKRKLAQMQANDPSQGMYLTEARPSLAAAELQQILTRIISTSGGQLVSTQIIDQPPEQTISAIAVNVRLRCEVDELVQLLYALESSPPLLFTENLLIAASSRVPARTVQVRTRGRAPVRRAVRMPSLDVRFDLIAYTEKGVIP